MRQVEVGLVSIGEGLDDTTPMGRAMANIVATFAQLEREVIGERTAAALRYKREHLHVYGHTPYGFKRKGDQLLPNASELAVIEVSSFQLEWVRTLRPTIGVYLNLSEDHLDRYQDLAEYAAAKANLFARQTRRDHAVLNGADPVVRALAGRLASRAAW